MKINVADPVQQTAIFLAIFIVLVIATIKKNREPLQFTRSHTDELKGFAILMVIFGHIGYFLASDDRFLWPLSVAAGVGVNLFLFLSGFGLTAASLKEKTPLKNYYLKRFLNIYPPMWVVIAVFLLMDGFLLQRTYSTAYIVRSFSGFFPNADLSIDLNSPLWYFTFIVFYYLLFPILFSRKFPVLSALVFMALGLFLTKQNLPINRDVLKLYQTHTLAFPLGMIFHTITQSEIIRKLKSRISHVTRYTLIITACGIAGYTAIHSNVGQGVYKEHLVSLVTVTAFVAISVLKNFSSRFLMLAGAYSYEIYLIHWPLLSRYEYLYRNLPPYLATLAYLALFLSVSWTLKKGVRLIGQLLPNRFIVRNGPCH